jgi:kynurenine formamidase
MIRAATLMLVVLLVGCSTETPFPSGRIVDLSHPFDQDAIYWPTESGFALEKVAEGVTPTGYFYAANRFAAAEHGGTHIDAPYHFSATGQTVDAIPLERLIGPGVVVDASQQCAGNRDYLVTVEDFTNWEKSNGSIPDGAMVLINTGFGAYWPDRERYMGSAELGAEAVAKLHFPGLNPDAARWLATERKIGAIGLDTPSIDHGPSKEFKAHVVLFEHDIPAFENVANLNALPAKGFHVIALPMKIDGGSGGPLRIIAIVPE